MDENRVNLAIPNCTNLPDHIAVSSTIIEEGPRICPLCNSIVKLFYINFNEQVMMCENTECEFPFGYEELQFVKDVGPEDELANTRATGSNISGLESITTASVLSAAEWSEIEKINFALESEDIQSEVCAKDKTEAEDTASISREKDEQIKLNLQSIKALNKVIHKDKCVEDELGIRNEKWIRNLLHMQKSSGIQLVNKLEVNKLRKMEPQLGLGELVIDIDKGNEMSSIKIEIVPNTNKNA